MLGVAGWLLAVVFVLTGIAIAVGLAALVVSSQRRRRLWRPGPDDRKAQGDTSLRDPAGGPTAGDPHVPTAEIFNSAHRSNSGMSDWPAKDR